MRILQVVTLISPTGEYGGPVRVALNQAAALRKIGVEVEIAAATRGFNQVPTEIDGVGVHLFAATQLVPGTGFAGLTSRGLRRWLKTSLDTYDAVHVHVARDLVTLPAARSAMRAGLPLVLQPHGMIDESAKALARPLDRTLTRPVLTAAHTILTLTPAEAESLVAIGADRTKLQHLPNGVPETKIRADAAGKQVLFLGRLHPRKRGSLFARVAVELSATHPDWTFRLVGPDEGDGEAVTAIIDGHPRIAWEPAVAPEEVLATMSRASLYCLPSVDEPFPMSVLEAMSVGLPVVVTQSNGLAGAILTAQAGAVIGPTQTDLRDALTALMADPDLRLGHGHNAVSLVRSHFTMSAVADQLKDAYRAAVG